VTATLVERLRQPIGKPRISKPGIGKPGIDKPAPRSAGLKKARKVNPVLIGLLGLVAVAALGHVMLPHLLGGGSVAPFNPPVLTRHLVARGTLPSGGASPAGSGGGVTPVTRTPFAPPPGYTH
jgi:hypothetical protein